jgi:putative Mg2+ transporter-C (MgtC) family protein
VRLHHRSGAWGFLAEDEGSNALGIGLRWHVKKKRFSRTRVGPDSMDLIDLNWSQIGEHLVRVVASFALALPLGWERGRGRSSVGLRTFPVVAMASCGYALIVRSLPGANAETMAHLLQGLVAGIGFIGGGAILKSNMSVRGLVTAASIWNTGAIGVGMAYGYCDRTWAH